MNKNDILYDKEPSFIYNVDYKGIASELWNTTIDENDNDEDKYIKQLIGNVMLIMVCWRREAQQATKA